MKPSIALVIPHTPWIPRRVESMARLRSELALGHADGPQFYREYTERAPNRVWALAIWRWLRQTRADVALVLQDDVMIAPYFWGALRAMLANLPPRATLGLTSVHPIGVEIARRGHRWFRTNSWHVGWAHALWRTDFDDFVAHAEASSDQERHEDDLLNDWVGQTGRQTWHPVPTIVDHDTSIASTYAGDAHSMRRPAVSWRGYAEGDLISPDFWKISGKEPEEFALAPQRACICAGIHARRVHLGELEEPRESRDPAAPPPPRRVHLGEL